MRDRNLSILIITIVTGRYNYFNKTLRVRNKIRSDC